jgi:hypothetical protein
VVLTAPSQSTPLEGPGLPGRKALLGRTEQTERTVLPDLWVKTELPGLQESLALLVSRLPVKMEWTAIWDLPALLASREQRGLLAPPE